MNNRYYIDGEIYLYDNPPAGYAFTYSPAIGAYVPVMAEGDDSVVLYWQDLRFPASNATKLSGHEPDDDAETGLFLFDSDTVESCSAFAQLPHGIVDSVIHPHVHWFKTTDAAGDVVWELKYKFAPLGGLADADWTTLTTKTSLFTDTDEALRHLMSVFAPIDISGARASDCFFFRISRLADDEDDTYDADALMAEFDIHYLAKRIGSATE